MPDVFISYSRKDGEFSRHLHQKFSELGKDVWMDWEDIPLTSDWWEEIRKGIETSDNFILVMSPESIGSPVCQLEIDHALKFNKRIIPLFHRDPVFDTALDGIVGRVQADKHLSKMTAHFNILDLYSANRDALSKVNWVFFKPDDIFDEKFPTLLKTVDEDLAHIRQHTRLLARALEWDHNDHNVSFIISGDELEAAEKWLAGATSKQPAPVELHDAYIRESRRVETSRNRLLRVLQGASVVLGFLIVIAIGAFFTANQRADYAQQQVATATVAQGIAIQYAQVAEAAATDSAHQAAIAEAKQKDAERAANDASTQVGIASTDVANARQAAEDYSTDVAEIGATLTPVPVTLTAVAVTVQGQEIYANMLRLGVEASDRLTRTDGNDETAALLAIRSLQLGYNDIADKVIMQVLPNLITEHLLSDFAGPVNDVDYDSTGTRLVVGAKSGIMRIYDATTATLLFEMRVANSEITSVAYSPDGRFVASGHTDGSYALWDATTGTLLWQTEPRGGVIWELTFSPNATLLAVGWDDGYAQLDEISAPQSNPTPLYRGNFPIYGIDFTPNSRVLALADGRDIYILQASDQRQAGHFQVDADVYDLKYSPDGTQIAAGLRNARAEIYSAGSGRLLAALAGHIGSVNEISYNPDGTQLVTGGEDSFAIIWDIETQIPAAYLRGHTDRIFGVVFNPDGKHVATASVDGTARTWNLDNYGELPGRRMTLPANPLGLAVSPDGQYLAVGTDAKAYIYALATGEVVQSLGHNSAISAVTFTPNSQSILTGGDDGNINISDVQTGEVKLTLDGHGSGNRVLGMAISPDGTWFASAGSDNTVRIWQVANWSRTTVLQVTGMIGGLAWSPDSQQLVASVNGRQAALVTWAVGTWQMASHPSQGPLPLNGVAYSPDGRWLAAGSDDFMVHLWQTSDWRDVQTIRGHSFWVKSVAWSPDGNLLLTTSDDFTARLVDVTSLNQGNARQPFTPYRVYQGHDAAVLQGVFGPDGSKVATISADGTLQIWEVNVTDFLPVLCARLPRDFTDQERGRYRLDNAPTCPAAPN